MAITTTATTRRISMNSKQIYWIRPSDTDSTVRVDKNAIPDRINFIQPANFGSQSEPKVKISTAIALRSTVWKDRDEPEEVTVISSDNLDRASVGAPVRPEPKEICLSLLLP